MSDEYDSPWKTALERYFPEFMLFFFPAVHAGIDWSREVTFLDKELQKVIRDAELGRRYVDKLVQVWRTDGDESWVCIHIEVQAEYESDFAKRMFTCHYRLFDRYDKPLASLAVLADDRPSWRPQGFGYELFGCRMQFDFPVIKLRDFQDDLDSLLASDNAFALVTAAHLLTQQTRHNPEARYQAKIRLVRILYRRNWDRQRILDLFAVIDWLMHLPDELAQKLGEDIQHIEEEHKMRYVTSVERLAIKKGEQKGQHSTMIEVLQSLLAHRFGAIPEWAEQRIQSAEMQQLKDWFMRALDASSVEEALAA